MLVGVLHMLTTLEVNRGFAGIDDGDYGRGRTAGAIALIGGGGVFRKWVEGLAETRKEKVRLYAYAQTVMWRHGEQSQSARLEAN